jgi:hypothetical protein
MNYLGYSIRFRVLERRGARAQILERAWLVGTKGQWENGAIKFASLSQSALDNKAHER